MEKQNEMLSRFETTHSNVATQNKTITVQELLNVTEEDAINIVSANSIPANMPAGTYYELDENRYASRLRNDRTNLALLSRGVDRENDLVNDTYVVSENFTVYYIITGTTGTLEINDIKVNKLFMNLLQINDPMSIESQNYTKELKKELHINNVESNNMYDILFTILDVFDENNENIVIYFYTIDRMYILNLDSFSLEYLDKEQRTDIYQYAKKTGQILTELESVFIGKTKTEILEKYNNRTIDSYILEKCKNIKNIKIGQLYSGRLYIQEVYFELNGTLHLFDDYNTFELISDGNGKYIYISVTAGS